MTRIFPQAMAIIGLLIIAGLLRGHQFLDQVLLDDEWHAVHQVMFANFKTIATSFGLADYSIPLTLYDMLLAKSIGLSEVGMRLPMLIAGLALIAVFVREVWQRLGMATALVFGALLVISPLLFYYSRIARPYGITVFLVPLAMLAFERGWNGQMRHGLLLYCFLTPLLLWMHLIVAPFLAAPMILALWRSVFSEPVRRRKLLIKWLKIALVVALPTIALVAPPFLMNTAALSDKTGVHIPNLETWLGAMHQWFGVSQPWLLGLCGFLAMLGVPTLWQRARETLRIFLLGFILTCGAIYLLKPAWASNALVLARYLLPILPLLLLSVAAGFVRLFQVLSLWRLAQNVRQSLGVAAALGMLYAMWLSGPLPQFFDGRQSYSNHAYFHFDVRTTHNPVRKLMDTFSQSSGWQALTSIKSGNLTIAAAPWALSSYCDEQPLWEARSEQRIIPLSTEGVCTPWQGGLALGKKGINLRNFAMLGDRVDLANKGIDAIALRKVYPTQYLPDCTPPPPWTLAQCVDYGRARYPVILFEDETMIVLDARKPAP